MELRGAWCVIVCSCVLAGVGVSIADEAVTAAPQASSPLDRAVVDRTRQLRVQVGVDDEALAAMGVSAVQAKAVVAACGTWYGANQAACATLQTEVVAARRAQREAVRRVRVGPRDETLIAELPVLKQQVEAAEAAQIRFVREGLGGAVDAQLIADQQTLRQRLLANADLPMPYRAMSLTAAQKQQLAKAKLRCRDAVRKARTAEQRAQAVAALQATEQQVLTADQLLTAGTWASAAANASEVVSAGVTEGLAEAAAEVSVQE